MKRLSRETYRSVQKHPEQIIMFGTGAFLRGFAAFFVDQSNKSGLFDGSIVAVQSTSSKRGNHLNEQGGLFTLIERGIWQGEEKVKTSVISSISRSLSAQDEWDEVLELARNPEIGYIISNTTEKGLQRHPDDHKDGSPPASFPAKLCRLLFERYRFMGQDRAPGFLILPCELLPENGAILKSLVTETAKKWEYESGFFSWLDEANLFCNTLVDRIVPGSPQDEELPELDAKLGYYDTLITTAEWFRFWAVEWNNGGGSSPNPAKFPVPGFLRSQEGIELAADIRHFSERKLRLLNATHTIMTPVMILRGFTYVHEVMQDKESRKFVHDLMLEEIIPSTNLDPHMAEAFALEVLDRFSNPFIKHELQSIAFQSTFKWKNRVLPLLSTYVAAKETLPPRILQGFLSLLRYNRIREVVGNQPVGGDGQLTWNISDAQCHSYSEFWQNTSEANAAETLLQDTSLWGRDISGIPGLKEVVEDGKIGE